MKFEFRKTNLILLIVAIIFTIVGYAIMATGDNTISVVILIVAYVILFPASIMVGFKKHNK
ncbi:MAG: hypothetical protein KAS49_01045 [Candidatus Cloacimonetes bacterium]|nr:hypothetical protein [Candidatus Cloacimonadota bacterium]